MKQIRNITYSALCALVLTSCSAGCNRDGYIQQMIENSMETAESQYKEMIKTLPDTNSFPRTLTPDGELRCTHKKDWTEGFFPGVLWYLYEDTHDKEWQKAATEWTHSLEELQYLTSHHDIGFLMYCSYGNAYRLTKNKAYKNILIESANSLITRFNPNTGCLKSWNYRKAWNQSDEWFYPVIIDNMMNLELLYFASKVTGDQKYAKIATKHAETTAKYHLRADYSTYHVIDYDTITGVPLHKATCQGYADNSMWARGQAWAIYGYTVAYRETKQKSFLTVAEKCAERWLNDPSLPADKIPLWDFNADQEGYVADWNTRNATFNPTPRDASAAAIVASAFLELCNYAEDGGRYKKAAIEILESLSSPQYMAVEGGNGNFLLKQSVGSIPHNTEIDVPLIYADYYYLEALLRLKQQQ